VLVAGRWVLQRGQHVQAQAIAGRFAQAMAELWDTKAPQA
jgi:hypothetical protein